MRGARQQELPLPEPASRRVRSAACILLERRLLDQAEPVVIVNYPPPAPIPESCELANCEPLPPHLQGYADAPENDNGPRPWWVD